MTDHPSPLHPLTPFSPSYISSPSPFTSPARPVPHFPRTVVHYSLSCRSILPSTQHRRYLAHRSLTVTRTPNPTGPAQNVVRINVRADCDIVAGAIGSGCRGVYRSRQGTSYGWIRCWVSLGSYPLPYTIYSRWSSSITRSVAVIGAIGGRAPKLMIDRFMVDAILLGIVLHQFIHWFQYSRHDDRLIVQLLVVSHLSLALHPKNPLLVTVDRQESVELMLMGG